MLCGLLYTVLISVPLCEAIQMRAIKPFFDGSTQAF